jgi:hypothetical protein
MSCNITSTAGADVDNDMLLLLLPVSGVQLEDDCGEHAPHPAGDPARPHG